MTFITRFYRDHGEVCVSHDMFRDAAHDCAANACPTVGSQHDIIVPKNVFVVRIHVFRKYLIQLLIRIQAVGQLHIGIICGRIINVRN